MKHAYLITYTAYKMLHQASFLEIMYTYDIRRNDFACVANIYEIQIVSVY